jgi:Uma2 family endonuclease
VKTPRTVRIEVNLVPVACDIIAEYGDYLMLRDGVVVGVYKAEDEPVVKALVVKSAPVKPIEVSYDVVMHCLSNAYTKTLKGLLVNIREYLHEPSIPEHIVRDRLAALVKQGKVERVVIEGQSTKPYRCVVKGKAPPQIAEREDEYAAFNVEG